MYMKPKISPAIKYLMLDNMRKLVDAGAFIRISKDVDTLNNIKYNFYTKRNVRYTIIFEAEFNDINGKYPLDFEELYEKQAKLLETKDESDSNLSNTAVIEKIDFNPEEIKTDINDLLKDVNIESVQLEAEDSYKEEEKLENSSYKVDYDTELSFIKDRVPKSKVIINETNSDDIKQDVDKESLNNILDDLDL